jgi:SDR family mycofactocin-dependent oxidoreductase
MQRLTEKVALVTGAGRGQGRSHCVRLAEEGADVVAIDICENVDTIGYPLATEADLDETGRLVRGLGREVMCRKADVRDAAAMERVIGEALSEFGHLDVLAANAAISDIGMTWEHSQEQWKNLIDTNLTGVFNTVKPAVKPMIDAERGGAIIVTSSLVGLRGMPGCGPYAATKSGLVSFTQSLAIELGPHNIRVNSVHPTNVNTDMIHNSKIYRVFRPDVPADREVTREEFIEAGKEMNALPIACVEPVDVSNAVVWLASEEARYVTGIQLPVDAGAMVK